MTSFLERWERPRKIVRIERCSRWYNRTSLEFALRSERGSKKGYFSLAGLNLKFPLW
jgi:hypothetical protein